MIKKIKKLLTRINEWIIEKIREWLGIDKDLKSTGKTFIVANDYISKVKRLADANRSSIDLLDKKIIINRETLKNVVEISTDVVENNYDNNRGHSWAIISIGGKCQYVKFVDLDRRNMMEISQFLKQYEAGRHVIDTPYRDFFENSLHYFKKDNEGR